MTNGARPCRVERVADEPHFLDAHLGDAEAELTRSGGDAAQTAPFSIVDLRRRGFGGFVPVGDLDDEPLEVPVGSGVYAVVREATNDPSFLDRSDAGWYKGKDPTVPLTRLRVEWIPDVQTLYIGGANSLRARVGLLVEFSRARGRTSSGGGRRFESVRGLQEPCT